MFRVDRGVITKVAIDFYCQADVLAASTLAFLDYDEMAAVATSCRTGRALMHAPRFAHTHGSPHEFAHIPGVARYTAGRVSWSYVSCELCSWISGNRSCFECELCFRDVCLDCLKPGNFCIVCCIEGEGDAPLPTVVPMYMHAYYMSCELNDALTRRGDYLRYQELDVAFAWPYQLKWIEWLPCAVWGKDIEEGTPAELWPDTDDGF